VAKRVENEVEHAEKAFLRSYRLEGTELEAATTNLAHDDEFVQIFAKQPDDQRRAAFAAVEVRQVRLEKQFGRKAAIVAVVDKVGRVVARDLNINSLYGDDLKKRYPALGAALGEGNAPPSAIKDVW